MMNTEKWTLKEKHGTFRYVVGDRERLRWREGKREREGKWKGGWERDRVCVCVWVWESSSGGAEAANGQTVVLACELPTFAADVANSSLFVCAKVALLPALRFADERGACSSTLQICNYSCCSWWARKAPSLLDVWGHQHFSHLFNEEPPPVWFLPLPGWLDWCPQDVGVVMWNVNQVVEESQWPPICSPPAGVGANNLTKTPKHKTRQYE